MGQTCCTSHGRRWKHRCVISISTQIPCKTPSSPLPQGNIPCPGEGEASTSETAPSLREVRSEAKGNFTKQPPFSMPLVPPITLNKAAGYVPISHHHTLDGLHGSGAVAEDGARGRGSSGRGKEPGGMGKLRVSDQQVASREEVEEGTSLDDHPAVPPPLHPAAEGVTSRWGW